MRQISLDRKSNTASIDLSTFFYPLHVLQQASAQFKDIAAIDIEKEGNRATVKIRPREGNAEQHALHFCNYALGLKRELGKHA